MSNLIETVVQGKAKQFQGGEELAAAAPKAPHRYRSAWTPDNNSTNHQTTFEHGLGVIPASVQVVFSADLKTVYPVQWPWDPKLTGNPVTIGMDAQTVFLGIFSGSPLHGFWSPIAGWTTYTNGYWQVIATT